MFCTKNNSMMYKSTLWARDNLWPILICTIVNIFSLSILVEWENQIYTLPINDIHFDFGSKTVFNINKCYVWVYMCLLIEIFASCTIWFYSYNSVQCVQSDNKLLRASMSCWIISMNWIIFCEYQNWFWNKMKFVTFSNV